MGLLLVQFLHFHKIFQIFMVGPDLKLELMPPIFQASDYYQHFLIMYFIIPLYLIERLRDRPVAYTFHHYTLLTTLLLSHNLTYPPPFLFFYPSLVLLRLVPL